MDELYNENRYKLYAKRGLLQAHLEMIEIAIQQHNRHFEDTVNLRDPDFRLLDTSLFHRIFHEVDGI